MSQVIQSKSGKAGFIAAVALLGTAAVAFNVLTRTMDLHFKKQPVALRAPLKTIPEQMGDWVQVSKDQPLGHDVEDALAANEYVFRDYLNTKKADAKTVAALEDRSKTLDERTKLLNEVRAKHPDWVLNMAVTYYTGLVDTVAHIPDRCYIAGGFQPSEYQTPTWKTGSDPLEVRFINFEDQVNARESATRSVAYFFYVDGEHQSDPLEVRRRLQRLTEKHGYYAKVELMTLVKDRALSAGMMSDFLTEARPEIEKCLPDWNAVKAAEGKPVTAEGKTTVAPAGKLSDSSAGSHGA